MNEHQKEIKIQQIHYTAAKKKKRKKEPIEMQLAALDKIQKHFIYRYSVMKVDEKDTVMEQKDIIITYISKKYLWDSA